MANESNVSQAPVTSTPTAPTTTGAVPTAKTPAETVRMMKLKIDNVDTDMSEADVIKLAQEGKSAHKRFQEAAAAKKEAHDLISFLKSNPRQAFEKLGIDVRKFSEDTLMDLIQKDSMTPEQKLAAEREAKLKKYEDDEKHSKEAARQKEMADLEAKHVSDYNAMFIKALSESGLPRTPYTVKRMAELTLTSNKKGLNLDSSQIAKLVRQDYQAEMQALYGSADASQISELLGKDGVKKLQKHQVEQFKAKPQQFSKPVERQAKGNTTKTDSWRDLKRSNRDKLRGY